VSGGGKGLLFKTGRGGAPKQAIKKKVKKEKGARTASEKK